MDWKPTVMMMAVVIMYAVLNVLTKMAFNEGMHTTVFIVLRLLVAALFLSPIAYFKERKSRPKLSMEIFVYLFFSALLGASLIQWLFFLGLRYTTATFASAFNNTTPMFTFLLALAFKVEKIDVASRSGAAKLTGSAVGLAGATVLALYHGPTLVGAPSGDHLAAGATHGGARRWAVGSVALLGFSASWSLWFILQSKIGTKYPALYSGTAWMFLLSFFQMAAVGAATEKMSLLVWVPRTALQAVTVVFAGVGSSGLGFLAMSWCVERRGPVFTTAFMPLIQIVTAGIDVAVLHEQLHLGSVVGSAVVVVGLYLVLWGKSNEASIESKLPPPSHSKPGWDEETENHSSRIVQRV
ncbi:WAT1-related protein At3g30340-like [Triticum dicoccoides]|uniref:WAT1-related protein At3g30340-like n=1 Tax=Triticum dicoccoides TaxID=85692 RepID=UPI0018905A0D|nr:WAT1-related protein At3g30340-like [Triticum dicoccoides]